MAYSARTTRRGSALRVSTKSAQNTQKYNDFNEKFAAGELRGVHRGELFVNFASKLTNYLSIFIYFIYFLSM